MAAKKPRLLVDKPVKYPGRVAAAMAAREKTRALNKRLDSEVVPGSGLTGRDLAHSREAAVTQQFGPGAVEKEQQRGQDVAGWYDQYLKSLGQHQAAISAAQDQAVGQVNGIREGLAGAGAAPAGADAGNQQVAGQASAVRQAMLGSFGAMIAGQGANAKNYADTQTNVVGPGQKLQAQLQGGQRVRDLEANIGAFRQKFETDAKTSAASTAADNTRNDIALKALTNSSEIAAGKNATSVKTTRIRSNASVTAAKTRAQAQADAAAGKITAATHGYTAAQWASFTPEKRRQIKAKDDAAGKTPKTPRAGLGSLTQLQETGQRGKLDKAVVDVTDALAGKRGMDGHPLKKGEKPITGEHAIRAALIAAGYGKDIVNAAFDLAVNGELSPANVKALQAMGIHVGGHYKTAKKPTPAQVKKAVKVIKAFK